MTKRRTPHRVGHRGSAFARPGHYCPHCLGVVRMVTLDQAQALVDRFRPGLPRARYPRPGERFWWCDACLIPGSTAGAPAGGT